MPIHCRGPRENGTSQRSRFLDPGWSHREGVKLWLLVKIPSFLWTNEEALETTVYRGGMLAF